MSSAVIQTRFEEDTYPIGRFILDRARALHMSRSELASRLGYRDIGKGHAALAKALMTGTVPTHMAKHLADALQVNGTLLDSVVAETARQQHDEACQRILARETAYRAAFRPHLRTETTRTIPEPIFIAALVGTARLRLVSVPDETWSACADDRDRLVKQAIQDHHREHGSYVPAFGAVVSYTAVLMAGYRVDFGLSYGLNGDRAGPMRPVERLGEAGLGTKRGDSRLTGLFPGYTDRYSCVRRSARHLGACIRIDEPSTLSETLMPHAIIRGKNGRRHEVDFGNAPVRVEIYSSEETVEIFIEADFKALPKERRRFALINIPRHLFSEATAGAARRATSTRNTSSTC